MSSVPEVLRGVVAKAVTVVAPRMGELVDPEKKNWATLLDRPVDDVQTTDVL